MRERETRRGRERQRERKREREHVPGSLNLGVSRIVALTLHDRIKTKGPCHYLVPIFCTAMTVNAHLLYLVLYQLRLPAG